MLKVFDRVCNSQQTHGLNINSHKPSASMSRAKLSQAEGIQNDPPCKSQFKSNLSKSEQRGLKSLRKRVLSGELIIGETDKSKRFCVLKRQQYIDAGQKHVKNDLLVTPDDIKSVQNVINDHCNWLKSIFQCGINWNQSDRMSSNMIDRGEGVAPLHLLIKDHKGWTEHDGTPPL